MKVLSFKQHLMEKIDDYNLYHFTDYDSLISILESGLIEPTYDKLSGSGLSLTRNKNLKWTDSIIRLTFDKNELTSRYKIKPIHWFNMKHNWQGKDDYRKYGSDKKPETGQNIPANQYEERVLSEKDIPIKYIKSIKILNKDKKLLTKIKKLTNISVEI